MSFLDILFGRSRPAKSNTDAIFAITTGYVTLLTQLELKSTNKAGVCFRPVASSYFNLAEEELEELLKASGKAADSKVSIKDDSYGFKWVIIEDPDFSDLVTLIYLTGETLKDKGFKDQLLAAVFAFSDKGKDIYWIYNYKRGKFYPFVPRGQGQERDNTAELEFQAAMSSELPMEGSLEQWYALWGIPF